MGAAVRNNREQSFRYVFEDESSSFKPRRGAMLEARFGIDLRALASWRGDATPNDLRELDRDEAALIYEAEFWNACRADLVPTGVDYFLFDTSITCGTSNAQRWLRLVAGVNAFDIEVDDGVISLISHIDPEAAVSGLELFRRRRFKSDPFWKVLGPEWTNRCNRAKRRALKMIHGEL